MQIVVEESVVSHNDLASENATHIDEYKIEMVFSDGKKMQTDFGPFLRSSKHPNIAKYLDKEKFQNFEISNGNLNWNDYGLIFPVEDLYNGKV